MARFNTKFNVTTLSFTTDFSVNSENVSTKLENYIEIDKSSDIYTGEYEITPKAYQSQILDTKDKLLKDDITVKEIPISETSNISGGLTLYIGE